MPVEKKTNSNQSVGKALQIIEVLAASASPMRLLDIANAVDMPASTVLRMIGTLVEFGYVDQNVDTQRYYLTFKFSKIAASINSHWDIRDFTHHYIVEMSDKYGEAACVAVERAMRMIYIDIADGPDGVLKVMRFIGKQAPMHSTGVGKCLMLNYTDAQIDNLISSMGLERLTPHTLTTKDELVKELERIRIRGYALDDQECEIGVRCIAVPIRDYTNQVIAAVSLSGPIERMSYQRVEEISGELIETANEISKKLFYSK